jgi:hypothetical protein
LVPNCSAARTGNKFSYLNYKFETARTFQCNRSHENTGNHDEHVVLDLTSWGLPKVGSASQEDIFDTSQMFRPVRGVHRVQNRVQRLRDVLTGALSENRKKIAV